MNFIDLTEDDDEVVIIGEECNGKSNDGSLSRCEGGGSKRKQIQCQKLEKSKRPHLDGTLFRKKQGAGMEQRKPPKKNVLKEQDAKIKYQPIGIEYSVDVIDMVDFVDQSQDSLDNRLESTVAKPKVGTGDQHENIESKETSRDLFIFFSADKKPSLKSTTTAGSSVANNQIFPSNHKDAKRRRSLQEFCIHDPNARDESELHSGLRNSRLKGEESDFTCEEKTPKPKAIIIDLEALEDEENYESTVKEDSSNRSREQHQVKIVKHPVVHESERKNTIETQVNTLQIISPQVIICGQETKDEAVKLRSVMNEKGNNIKEMKIDEKSRISPAKKPSQSLSENMLNGEGRSTSKRLIPDDVRKGDKGIISSRQVSSYEKHDVQKNIESYVSPIPQGQKTNDESQSNVILIDDCSEKEEKRNCNSSQPNFILIDDSSDEDEDQPFESVELRNTKKTSVKEKHARPNPKCVSQPSPYPSQDTKFRSERSFNYQRSNEEALAEQERLFSQSAARLHNHQPFLQEMQRQNKVGSTWKGPTFTVPVPPDKLNDQHWKWPCIHARLGLPKNANSDCIKKQYRKLALCYHPDKCRLPDATLRFQAVTEAYTKLKKT